MRKGRLLSWLLALVMVLGMVPAGAGAVTGAELMADGEFIAELEELGIIFYQGEDGAYLMEDRQGIVLPVEDIFDVSIADGEFIIEDANGRFMSYSLYLEEYGEDGEQPSRDEGLISWTAFAERVNAEAAEATGELIIKDEQVGGYQAGEYGWSAEDVPLGIPDGVQLIFENCQFAGMVLSHGDITLRGSSVGSGKQSAAITILEEPDYPRKTNLRLTIEEDSEIAPRSGAAITADSYYRQPSNITIVNHGTIAGEWMALDVNRYGHWGRNTNTSFALYNDGTIRGITRLWLSPSGGTMSLYVENSGLMESETVPLEMSLTGTRQTGKATFWNREGGIVRATASDAEAVRLRLYDYARTTTDWFTGEKWNPTTTGINGEMINEGLIEGKDYVVALDVRADNPSSVLMQGDGLYRATKAGAPVLYIQASQTEEAKDEIKLMQTPEELQALLKGWMEGLGFYYLPKEATAHVEYAGKMHGNYSGEPDSTFAYDLSAEGRPLEPMDWAVLVKQAEAAMTTDQREVCYYTQRQVLAPQDKDKALSVPEGQRLTLRGGQYDGMRLGGGDFILSKVTVAADGETPAALVVDGLGRPALRLMIEENTSILHGGAGTALDIGGKFGKDAVLDIENHGTIESQGQAARLSASATAEGTLTVLVENDGDITGKSGGLEIAMDTAKGALAAEVSNHAAITAETGHALAVRGVSTGGTLRVHLLNQQGAEMTSQGMEGVQLALTGAAKEGVPQGEGGLVYNQGLIRGKDAAVALEPTAARPVRMRLRGEGALEAEGAEVSVTFLQEQKKRTDEPIPEEDFAALRDLWLTKLGIAYLPEQAKVDSKLLTRAVEKGETLEAGWYERLSQGGGEAMPDLQAEAANFDAAIHLRIAGDGTHEDAEVKLDSYPFQGMAAFELRDNGRELWFDIGGEMVQYKDWAKLLKAKGEAIVLRGETPYAVGGLLDTAYAEMLGRQKQAPVEGTVPKGRAVLISTERLNEGLERMYPGAAFEVTGSEDEGFAIGVEGKTFWTQGKAKTSAPYLAEAPAAEGDIPFPQITVTDDGQYLDLYDACILYRLYAEQANH